VPNEAELIKAALQTAALQKAVPKRPEPNKCPDRTTGRGTDPKSACSASSDEFGFYYRS